MVSPRILQKLPTQSNDLIWNNGNNEFDNENEKQQQVAISALMNLSGEKGIQASFTICHDHQFDTDFNLYSISKWVILSMLTHTKKHVITLKCNQISSIKIKSCNNNATPNTEVSHVNTRIYGMHGLNKWNQKMKEPKAYTHQIQRLAHYFQHIYVHSGRFAAQFSVCCRVVVSEFPWISFICWLGKRKKSKEKSIIQQLSTQKIWRWATKQPLERSKNDSLTERKRQRKKKHVFKWTLVQTFDAMCDVIQLKWYRYVCRIFAISICACVYCELQFANDCQKQNEKRQQ